MIRANMPEWLIACIGADPMQAFVYYDYMVAYSSRAESGFSPDECQRLILTSVSVRSSRVSAFDPHECQRSILTSVSVRSSRVSAFDQIQAFVPIKCRHSVQSNAGIRSNQMHAVVCYECVVSCAGKAVGREEFCPGRGKGYEVGVALLASSNCSAISR